MQDQKHVQHLITSKLKLLVYVYCSYGSRLNSDPYSQPAARAQVSRESGGINSLKSPFLGFWVLETGYWPDYNLESFFFHIIKNIFYLKNPADFRKTVETGVDPRLFCLV